MPAKPVEPRRPPSRLHWKSLLWLTAVYVTVVLAWETAAVYPLRILVVYLHEISHGIAAYATGGEVEMLHVFAEEGGSCHSRGGNRFLILSSGYLGSMLVGAMILLVATRTKASRFVAASLGLLLMVAAAWYVPMDRNAFGKLFGMGVGAGIAALSMAPPLWSRAALSIIGLTSCLYAIVDIRNDVLMGSQSQSDAAQIAAITSVPAFVWGVLWIFLSLCVSTVAVKWSVVRPPDVKRPPASAKPARRPA